jgi:ATP-binding cassette subfamily B protein
MKPEKWWLVAIVFIVVVAAALDQATSYLFKMIVDAVGSGNTGQVFWLGIAFPVVIFSVQIAFRLSGFLMANLCNNTRKAGYNYLFAYVSKHSHSYFTDRFAGSVHNKMGNIVNGLDDLIIEVVWSYLYTLTALLVTFGFILSVDVSSAIVFICLVVLLIIVNNRLSKQKEQLSKESAEAKTVMNGKMLDILGNISAVRQYARNEHELGLVAEATLNMSTKSKISWYMTEYLLTLNAVILVSFCGLMFWLLASRWQMGEVTAGEFVLIASLITQLSGSLMFIGRAFNSTARTLGEMKEGLEDLMLPHDIIDIADNTPDLVANRGLIEWQDVDFTFGQSQVFSQFNLAIKAGQRIGLVGASGAGKSTFVSLMLRQHEVSAGSIVIDGQNIAEVTQDSLRNAIALVPQEPVLFHRSIRDNIAYGNPDATQAEIEQVARHAYAHDFIVGLEQGYETLVGERGVKLSGGQKQRIAIARAMLKNAPILILDEATSALDSESESEIQKALHILMSGKTVIAVAHRLSTLSEMDRIIVLENGKICEDGSHEVLKSGEGTYAKLWKHQAGGFITE